MVQQVLAAQGEGLVRALLRALCDTCPRRHVRALAGCLYQLLCSPWAGDAALQWLVGALRAPDLPGALMLLIIVFLATHQGFMVHIRLRAEHEGGLVSSLLHNPCAEV